jgi:sensor domain CHASE-containing protein
VLTIIEVEYYESNSQFQSLSEQIYAENSIQKSTFWDDATRYTVSANEDESFVNEIAYMMVTLHRTGA